MKSSLSRRVVAEAIGTMFLLAAVIGSGIMGERLAGGNVAIALLANTIATGTALAALILMLGPISGAHLNPAVTLSAASRGELNWRDAIAYISAQVSGAVIGAIAANLMFSLPPISFSQHARIGSAQFFSECVATFGLILVIRICAKFRPDAIAFVVAAYITSAYWFTASTSFANPAVTIARSLSNTFSGIRLADVPLFILAQLIGAALATVVATWLTSETKRVKS